tara:strand:+ start:161 stop:310 length:150 start_codon:yes stop_codon:yes gene_type:complete
MQHELFGETTRQRIKREAQERIEKMLATADPLDSAMLKGEVVIWPVNNS